uniref:hypothetical protein n=1 Tax=Streptosporangium sp. CA-235898 TaxID=3240073 RepID=UPI003F498B27
MTDTADMSTPGPAPNAYPVRYDGSDPRFTFGLAADVAAVLEAADYPKLSSDDFVELQLVLYRFLYGPRQAPQGTPPSPAGSEL